MKKEFDIEPIYNEKISGNQNNTQFHNKTWL